MGWRDVVLTDLLRFGPKDFVFKTRPPAIPMFEDSVDPISQASIVQRVTAILAQAVTGVAPAVMPPGTKVVVIPGYGPKTPVKLAMNSLYGVIGNLRTPSWRISTGFSPTPYRQQPPDPRWWRRRKAEKRGPLLAVYRLDARWRLALGRLPGGPKRHEDPPWWLAMSSSNPPSGIAVNARFVEELRLLGKIDLAEKYEWEAACREEVSRTARVDAVLRGRREPVRAPKAREAGGGRRPRACGLDGRWRVSVGG